MTKRVAVNPRATAAQVWRLYERKKGDSMEEAALHPNAPLELLFEIGNKNPYYLGLIKKNPSWPLYQLAEPDRCAIWEGTHRHKWATTDMQRVAESIAVKDIGQRRLAAWAVECASAVAKVRRGSPCATKSARCLRMALRFLLGKARTYDIENCLHGIEVPARTPKTTEHAICAATRASLVALGRTVCVIASTAISAADDAQEAVLHDNDLACAVYREHQLRRLVAYARGQVAWLEAAFVRFGIGQTFHPEKAPKPKPTPRPVPQGQLFPPEAP